MPWLQGDLTGYSSLSVEAVAGSALHGTRCRLLICALCGLVGLWCGVGGRGIFLSRTLVTKLIIVDEIRTTVLVVVLLTGLGSLSAILSGT